VLETIWPALEAEAKEPSGKCAEILLFPRSGSKKEEWFKAFRYLEKAGFVELAPGIAPWANVSWKLRPIRRIDLTGPAQHSDLYGSGDESYELAFAYLFRA
jgi:hypothetical protein